MSNPKDSGRPPPELFAERPQERKMTSHGSGNDFSSEKCLPTLRETCFQAKNDFPRFGKRVFERKMTSHGSGNGFSSEK